MTSRRSRARAAATALAIVTVGLSTACATSQPRDPDRVLKDATTTSRIKAGILRDPVLAGSAVDVEVADGVVTLSGEVPNDAAAARVIEISRTAPGVRRVEDRLARASAPGVPEGPSGTSGTPGPPSSPRRATP